MDLQLPEGFQEDFMDFITNFVNLLKSLYQYFSDLFKYASGDGDVPEVEPVGD